MESIKNVIKDLQNILKDVESLERLKKAREEDVQHLEAYVEQRKMEFYKLERKYNKICNECKLLQNANQEWNDLHVQRNKEIAHLEQCIEKLQKQNVQLSEQVEKHLEEKSNGNWAREGAVVWDSKDKLKGVLLENPTSKELNFVSFVPNSGIENWPFLPHSKGCEPYKGQDKEEVEPIDKEKEKFQKFLEQIEVGDVLIQGKLVVSVLGKYSDEFEFLALTSKGRFFKGSTGFSKAYDWAKYDANNLKLPF